MPPPLRILIVEDEAILADNLKSFLVRRTPDVRVAPDAETALEMLRFFTPDLIVLDYALPGIDGLRAYAEIARASSRPPACLLITAYPTALMAESARRQGIRQLLDKPFSLAELQDAIDAIDASNINNSLGNRRVMERRSRQLGCYPAERRCQPGRRQAQDGHHALP